jgi:hypothetical protein
LFLQLVFGLVTYCFKREILRVQGGIPALWGRKTGSMREGFRLTRGGIPAQ